mgnify:CR=1 FL=1
MSRTSRSWAPDGFLASGHPAPGAVQSPYLGLIASSDAGQSWREVSLGGRADLHVIRIGTDGRSVWPYDALRGELMTSRDRGQSWGARPGPEAPSSSTSWSTLTIPRGPSAEHGLVEIRTGSTSWDQVGPEVGTAGGDGALYVAREDGTVLESSDGGVSWRAPRGLVTLPSKYPLGVC